MTATLYADRRNVEARDSTRHYDARSLDAQVVAFLAAHPGVTRQGISREAGVDHSYLSKLHNGHVLECRGDKARKLLAAMKRIGKEGTVLE